MRVLGQAPDDSPGFDLVRELQHLGWVDVTALCVLGVFCVLGLFKGLVWQVSRIAILIAAYVLAGRYGPDLGAFIAGVRDSASQPAAAPETTVYVACALVFLVVVVGLSLFAVLLRKLVHRAGLSFFDRVGGGVFGVATGGCVVLALLFVVNMFFRQTHVAEAASSSHSLRLSTRAIELLGDKVPDDLRRAFRLEPLDRDGDADAGNRKPTRRG